MRNKIKATAVAVAIAAATILPASAAEAAPVQQVSVAAKAGPCNYTYWDFMWWMAWKLSLDATYRHC